MIAHRLQTIMTAENLIYLESSQNVITASKGTAEYTDIMERLKKTNYAHQVEEDNKEENKDEGGNEDGN